MDNEGKESSFVWIFIVMTISLVIASLWETIPAIKNSAHAALNPTAGLLLNWNLTWGMTFLVLIIALFMTIIQKYATDQKTMREMRDEQKALQEEMKRYKDHPEKLMSLQKKQFEFMPKMMKLSMRPLVYTAIPLILFFRWFVDYFGAIGEFKFFGYFSWFWFYLLGSIVFSSILRKVMNVV